MKLPELHVYNSLTRQKELFTSLKKDYVGMYVCGPTVYSDVHLGNCRTFISFDVIYRYLQFLGNKVRYVRNITDVGHLENDVDDEGEDKIAKKARLESVEPMEIAQRYTKGFHDVLDSLNTLRPNIEPSATGHIIEQIEVIEKIFERGLAYEVNGSVYFDTKKYTELYPHYGQLSGKRLDDLFTETRTLKNQSEKRNNADFALWMKADSKHIMKWKSPWSVGFPGWHLECSAMSTKYLGEKFDIHGGGMDLQFPHHENEIAQNVGSCGCEPAQYWLHGNMLTLNGKKMSKRDGSSILPGELFSGDNDLFSKGYSPMTLRFLCLQSHYRSTLDLSDHALAAAEKGYKKLMEANKVLADLKGTATSPQELDATLAQLQEKVLEHLSDDFNTPQAVARLFDMATTIFSIKDGHISQDSLQQETITALQSLWNSLLTDVLGLKDETNATADGENPIDGLMDLILDIRKDARENKDWGTSDKIRDHLKALEIVVKDGKEGTTWTLN